MNELQFTVLGRPQQRGSKIAQPIYRHGSPVIKNGRVVTVARDSNDEKSLTWMQETRTSAFVAMEVVGQSIMLGPIELAVSFYFMRPKSHYGTGKNSGIVKGSAPTHHVQSPDLAKLVRCLEDSLTGIVWQDDRQVLRYSGIQRFWTTEQERAHVLIREYIHS